MNHFYPDLSERFIPKVFFVATLMDIYVQKKVVTKPSCFSDLTYDNSQSFPLGLLRKTPIKKTKESTRNN